MIPLSSPNLSGNELKYVTECIETNWVSSVGSYVDKFEKVFAEFVGAKYAVSVVNGSAALHISLILAGVKRDDYVILPNITFIASANTTTYTGAKPLLMDIDPETWQMDLDLLESFFAEETEIIDNECFYKKDNMRISAIMPVHVLGNIGDIERLVAIAESNFVKVVEDATEALGSFYKNKHAGTHGLFGCCSFNGNKIITTGGGGMIYTNDEILAKKAKHITTQAKSDPFEYVHDEIGYNYRLVNVLAAIGVAQMEQLPGFIERKLEVARLYKFHLSELTQISFQKIGTPDTKPNNWLFTVKAENQKELMQFLLGHQIQVRPFWVPMNKLEMFKSSVYYHKSDVSNQVYQNCVSLPCSTHITDEEVHFICSKIKEFYK